MLRYPCLRVGQPRDHAGLERPRGCGDRRRRAPRQDEPEDVRMTANLEECQRRHEGGSPEEVVEKGPAAAPEREESVSPAVLQQEPWKGQPEGEERDSFGASQKAAYPKPAGAGR